MERNAKDPIRDSCNLKTADQNTGIRMKAKKKSCMPRTPAVASAATEDLFRNRVLYPVILAVPEAVQKYKPKDRVIFLSRHARHALELSAEKSGLGLGELKKADSGAPLPCEGIYWSVTHKTAYVGGVVAPLPIGIDIEEIKACSRGLFEKTACHREWSLAGTAQHSWQTFFRYWTSKEAVLKVSGAGIKDLSKCCIRRIVDENYLEIAYQDKLWLIEHYYFDAHIASIVKPDYSIEWTIR